MVSLDIWKLMTFVLLLWPIHGLASPQQDVELDTRPTTESEQVDSKTLIDQKGVIVTQPMTSEKTEKSNYFYPYRQSMSPKLGLVIDPDLIKESDLPLIIGIRYLLPRRRSPQWEVGFDIVTDEGAHISVGQRYIINPRSPFRPYFALSGLLVAQAEEQLATITDYKNYFIKMSGGFEDIIKLPMSVRIEAEFAVGIERQFALLNFGYSWGW